MKVKKTGTAYHKSEITVWKDAGLRQKPRKPVHKLEQGQNHVLFRISLYCITDLVLSREQIMTYAFATIVNPAIRT